MADLPLGLWIAFAVALGLVVGSFLNVVILRLPERLDAIWRRDAQAILELEPNGQVLPPGVVREPSHCPSCKHPLSATDNIPVLSWVMLRGRCRYCKVRISAQYPLVEILCGTLSAIVIWKLGASWTGAAGLMLTWTLIALSGIDVRTQLLPDQLTLPLLWAGLLLSLGTLFIAPPASILGATLGYMSLWSVFWLFKLVTGKEGMGYGDFKLLAAIGAWMGPYSLLPVVLMSSLIGAIVGMVMVATRQQQRNEPIPFGPFIAAAGWVWFIEGNDLLHWYSKAFTPSL